MTHRALFLMSILLAATPLFARDKTDVVLMKNGDRLTCEIKGLNNGVLSVSLDYVDGTVSVDWSKVARLESHQVFVVLTQGGSSYQGTLATAETPDRQPTTIELTETIGQRVDIDKSQVVRMDATSDRFFERFNGAVNFGVVYSKGNEATQYNLGSDTQYLRERWGADATLTSTLSSNSGSNTSTRNQVNLRSYRLLRWNNYFYEGFGNFLQSSVQGIALQSALGGGIGHFFKNTDQTSISVLGGAAWQKTEYTAESAVQQGTQNVAAGLIAADVKLFKFKKTNLNATATLLPFLSDPGRVNVSANASYYLKLFSNLSWNWSFYGSWDNRPPAGLTGSDYGFSSGLSWTYGNR